MGAEETQARIEMERKRKRAAWLGKFSRRLRAVNKVRFGYTPAQLGGVTDRDPSLVGKWLKGIAEPGAGNLAVLAEALEVSADYLLHLTDDPTPTAKRAPGAGATPETKAQKSLGEIEEVREADRPSSRTARPPRRRRPSGPTPP